MSSPRLLAVHYATIPRYNNILRSTDGTGEPNAEGINYYNNLIDALLEKGAFIKPLFGY